MLNYVQNQFLAFIGFESNTTSHVEKLVSVAGGFVCVYMIIVISAYFVGTEGAALLVASMGASTVLVFSVPHGPLSQPWQLIGGHTVSALIGVTVAMWLPGTLIPGALAVALAIGAMHYLRCIHPPGGGTALAAVVGGPAIHTLGYYYVLTPVLLNTVILLAAAIAFNYLFPWRRYPAKLGRRDATSANMLIGSARAAPVEISHEDLEYALRTMNLYVDVTEEDLSRIYRLARFHHHGPQLSPDLIARGHFYSNGKYNDRWAIYEVVEESVDAAPGKDRVVYKIVAGIERGASGILTREEFAQTVRYEVFRNENSWQRATGVEDAGK